MTCKVRNALLCTWDTSSIPWYQKVYDTIPIPTFWFSTISGDTMVGTITQEPVAACMSPLQRWGGDLTFKLTKRQ